MTRSHLRCIVTLCWSAVAAGVPAAYAADASETSVAAPSLHLALIADAALPARAQGALVEEVGRLWGHEGLDITWRAVDAPRTSSETVLPVFVRRGSSSDDLKNPHAVAELVRPAHGQPVAVVFVDRARRMVEATRPGGIPFWLARDDYVLGIVLGRAIAHEIGHYVLDTSTHAATGLMRPAFDPREFTDLREGIFALDRRASEWLRGHSVPFSYAR